MKPSSLSSLSSLALVPCLLCVSNAATAATVCTPTASPTVVRPGGEVTLRGNCIDTDTNQPVASGSEVWEIQLDGASEVGRRSLPNGTLTVTAPTFPGEVTYLLPRIAQGYGGYGGDINLTGVSVRVTVQEAAPAPASDATLGQLTTPLTALQHLRMRSNLEQAQSRLRTLRSSKTNSGVDVYVTGLGDLFRQDRSDAQSGFKVRTTAVSLGADYRLNDDWVVGGNVGAAKSHADFAESASDQRSKSGQATAYTSWSLSPTSHVSATLSYELTRFRVTRDDGAGQLSYSTPRGHGLGLSVTAGRDFTVGPVSVGPYVRWDHIATGIDAFDESGSPSAVSMSEQKIRSNLYNIGAQTQISVPVSWGILLPYLRLEFTHRNDKTASAPTARLLNGNTTLLLPTSADTSGGYGNAAIGLTGVNQGGLSWFADFETGIAQKGYRTQRFGLGLRVEL